MPAGICPRQLEVGLERGGKVVGGSALDEKQFGRPWWETSRAWQDPDDGLPYLQHLCHHLRRNFAGDDAHLAVQGLPHIVGVEARAQIDLLETWREHHPDQVDT